jgi:hypothetical protein
MRLPDRILNTACLLGFKKETPQYAGSGFVVDVPGTHGNSHLYLVTAQRIAERLECCPIVMGFSYKDGTKALLEADTVHWYAHPTDAGAVDAAVTPFGPFQSDLLDLEPIPQHLFALPEEMCDSRIAVGEEIAAIGVFTRFSYHDRHLPIIRTGNLAMLPTLKIPVKNFEPMEAWVGEIEGLSGSPVWMRRPADMQIKPGYENGKKQSLSGDSEMLFLGLLHGPWEIPEREMEGQSAHYTECMATGMSVIVPAHKILEVIHQPELEAMRKKQG